MFKFSKGLIIFFFFFFLGGGGVGGRVCGEEGGGSGLFSKIIKTVNCCCAGEPLTIKHGSEVP